VQGRIPPPHSEYLAVTVTGQLDCPVGTVNDSRHWGQNTLGLTVSLPRATTKGEPQSPP
jgi:hypothetical protein